MTIKNSIKILSVLATLALANPASASGLLGQNYYSGSLGYSWLRLSPGPNPDGWVAGVAVNKADRLDDQIAFDWGGMVGHARMSSGPARARSTDLDVYVTGYLPHEGAKPFVSVATGWAWYRFRGPGFSPESDNSWTYGFRGGIEVPLGPSLSVTPAVAWDRVHDARESRWSGALRVHNWFSDQLGGSLSYAFTEGPDRAQAVTAGVTLRY